MQSPSLPPALDAAVPTIVRWCGRLDGPGVDAEDAAQDVLEVAVQRYSTLRRVEALDAWLFGITRRVLARHRRRVWWKRWVGAVPEDRSTDGPLPDHLIERHQRAAQLRRWLEHLPRAQREVVVLCALEERSRADAARILDVPEGTVKSRYRLALDRLRTLAQDDGLQPLGEPT